MNELTTLNALLLYSDRMNRSIFTAAGALDDATLDRSIDIGLGSLRRILIHIHNGEHVWLARWRGEIETKWPREDVPTAPAEVLRQLEGVWEQRRAFLTGIAPQRLDVMQNYRDSKGSLFKATLRDMILQGIIHSTHHRAQAVNALRRLGGERLEVDYMVGVRQAV